MPQEQKTVFISYRRSVAPFIARSIFLDLRAHDYDVFMDVESIDSGTFDTIILNQIEARAHFVLILTPGTLERCAEPGDWLRREIEYAMEKGRNIVPLFVNEFKYDETAKKLLTGDLAQLPRFNGLNVPHDYFDEAMKKLRTRFLKQLVSGVVKPTPAAEIVIIEEKIEEVAAQPAPTKEELSAEEYFSRAYLKQQVKEFEGAIADYTEAIRLNPQFAEAYNDRGGARKASGDLKGALNDYEQAILLNPQLAHPYNNRGNVRHANGDLSGALADYDEAIRLNPQFNFPYINRAYARASIGDLNGAFADFDEAIRLNPQYVGAYINRGILRYEQGDLNGAFADYGEAIRLNPQLAETYANRGEVFFAMEKFEEALTDFQQSNVLEPEHNITLAGLAITQFMLENYGDAKRIWRELVAQDGRYMDADWVGKELNWRPELVEAARQLIATL